MIESMSQPEIDALSDEELKRLVDKADVAYDKSCPIMLDEVYDNLVVALQGRGVEAVSSSPTMLSLEKGYSREEIQKWADKITGKVTASTKLDGMALELHYEGGVFKRAFTKGSKKGNEEVTEAIMLVASVPKTIPVSVNLKVRGEAYTKFSDFAWINQNVKGKTYENPRNTTAGAIKTKKVTGDRTDFEDHTKTILNRVTFEAYGVAETKLTSYLQLLKNLKSAGFNIPEVEESVDAGFKLYDEMEANREKYDKPADGIVFRADGMREYDDLGATSHHPRGAIAFKFTSEKKITTLNGVEWSIGRTNRLTPVGLVEPTRFPVSGVTVERVTLHNIGQIKTLGISIGAKVTLTRSGDVIPTVLDVVQAGHTPLVLPSNCPDCNAATKEEDDFLVCTNDTCSGAQIRAVEHFCKAIEMDGFGPGICDKLHQAGILRNIADLYTLNSPSSSDSMKAAIGEKTADKLLAEIEAKGRQIPFPKFLAGLGIDNVGRTMSKRLEAILEGDDPEDILKLPDVITHRGDEVQGLGETVKQNIVQSLPKSESILRQLKGQIKLIREVKIQGPLTGQSFVFTGKLPFSRSEAQKKVVALGGETPSSVQKGLTYLVVGDGEEKSTKLKKAEKLGVKIMTTEEFQKVVA